MDNELKLKAVEEQSIEVVQLLVDRLHFVRVLGTPAPPGHRTLVPVHTCLLCDHSLAQLSFFGISADEAPN